MQKQSQKTTSWFETLSDSALIKLDRIVKTPNNPDPLIDTSRSTWWRWVAAGSAPEPVRLTAGTTLWRVGALREWLRDPVSYSRKLRHGRNSKTKLNRPAQGGI
jgi:predicted DNA-binding transcriptional regulator AlpA